MTASSLRWPLLALLGLLVAAAIAFLATQVVSQKIGIASEPITAGRALAPRPPPAKIGQKPRHVQPTVSTTPPATTTPAPPPSNAPGDGGGEGGDD